MLDAHYKGKINISDYWSIGDSRTESISEIPSGTTGESQPAQSIELVIIGMNHDNLAIPIGDISKTAITVQTKNCLSNTGYMNSDYSGTGNALWSSSSRRNWCNSLFTAAISEDLAKLVKSVNKLSNRYGYWNDTQDLRSYTTQESTTDKVFLLSQYEITGENSLKSGDYDGYGTLDADGVQYEYMKTSGNRIKSGGSSQWWCRSSYVHRLNVICAFFLKMNTSMGNDFASYSFGIAPAFCL